MSEDDSVEEGIFTDKWKKEIRIMESDRVGGGVRIVTSPEGVDLDGEQSLDLAYELIRSYGRSHSWPHVPDEDTLDIGQLHEELKEITRRSPRTPMYYHNPSLDRSDYPYLTITLAHEYGMWKFPDSWQPRTNLRAVAKYVARLAEDCPDIPANVRIETNSRMEENEDVPLTRSLMGLILQDLDQP